MKNLLVIASAIINLALVSCGFPLDDESFGGEIVKGNGNVVTHTYDVTAFDELSNALPATVNFTVADDYSCTVRVDENIMEYLEIKVNDRELLMRKPSKYRNIGLKATTFVIDVTAPNLESFNLAGSGSLNVLSPMDVKEIEVNVAGSGDIIFTKPVRCDELEMYMAGSGSFECMELVANHLEGSIAGSGDQKVESGSVHTADISVAGSGDCILTCDIEQLEASVAGSGDIVARVSGNLDYSIIGSGSISYYGNPVLEGDKAGKGSIKRISE